MNREHPADTLPEGVTALVRRGSVLVHAHHWSGVWFESDSGKAMDGAPDVWIEIGGEPERGTKP